MSEHFEDSMGQQEYPCHKCGTFCYLVDKVDACDAQRLVAEVLQLREKNKSLLATLSEEAKTIDEWCAEVKRLREGIKAYLLRYLPEELEHHELKELIE